MLDLAQNPVYSVFFPDIFNFDFPWIIHISTLNKNMTNSYRFNYFDYSDTGLKCLFPAPASTYYEELSNSSCIDAFLSWNSVELKDHLPFYSGVLQRAFIDLLS